MRHPPVEDLGCIRHNSTPPVGKCVFRFHASHRALNWNSCAGQEQFDPRLSWADVEWVKNKWGGPLILKGIMDAEDASIAVEAGADAIVVSNRENLPC